MTDTQDKNVTNGKPIDPAENQSPKHVKPLSPLEAKRAQNLRDNLMKRKLQARARSDETP